MVPEERKVETVASEALANTPTDDILAVRSTELGGAMMGFTPRLTWKHMLAKGVLKREREEIMERDKLHISHVPASWQTAHP